ncbi:MAG: extracellular solute-binding protein [Alphaproteobacteria bacterium]|jgi:tungstate transport system substrate-binding protein|nr:extracellular solute-binding protein [Alphaproteobacteria bacterium]MDP6518203.1 extracellular solute-binding protein [Alphaproteobacteria bacterium]
MALATAHATTAGERFITLASTTSTENSGLFDHILPRFEQDSGIQVRVVAVGTGQAIRLARNGDADVILVHHRESEERLVADGHALARHDVMFNDFLVVGPDRDPAGIAGLADAAAALARIAESSSVFVSRGDDSGTHMAERALWVAVDVTPDAASGDWYREVGAGMGATLNTAAALDAYTLADRGTWLAFANKDALTVLIEGDPALFNRYGVLMVNPARHPHVKASAARAFVDWLLSPPGQAAIASFRIDGQASFFPNPAPAREPPRRQ